MNEPAKKIVLSGLRPTGRVHLGNYWGAVKNWVDLQDQYACRYFVADLHALTTDYADTSAIRESTIEAVTDWLSVGLDPAKSVIFVQSQVPQTAELALIFGMITPLGWLERVPTYKEQLQELREKDLGTYGFLGYPVLMTADIALYLRTGDEKALCVLPGIGKKSAARLVVELGQRVPQPDLGRAGAAVPDADSGRLAEALAVLGAMGLPPAAAVIALRSAQAADPALKDDLEGWVRGALRHI